MGGWVGVSTRYRHGYAGFRTTKAGIPLSHRRTLSAQAWRCTSCGGVRGVWFLRGRYIAQRAGAIQRLCRHHSPYPVGAQRIRFVYHARAAIHVRAPHGRGQDVHGHRQTCHARSRGPAGRMRLADPKRRATRHGAAAAVPHGPSPGRLTVKSVLRALGTERIRRPPPWPTLSGQRDVPLPRGRRMQETATVLETTAVATPQPLPVYTPTAATTMFPTATPTPTPTPSNAKGTPRATHLRVLRRYGR